MQWLSEELIKTKQRVDVKQFQSVLRVCLCVIINVEINRSHMR